jgi:hypothetical protein
LNVKELVDNDAWTEFPHEAEQRDRESAESGGNDVHHNVYDDSLLLRQSEPEPECEPFDCKACRYRNNAGQPLTYNPGRPYHVRENVWHE